MEIVKWERTDEFQFVHTVDQNNFIVLETIDVAGEFFVLKK